MFPVSKRSGSATCRDPAQNHLWFIHRHVITYSYGLGFTCGPLRNPRNAFHDIVTRLYRPYIYMLVGVVSKVWLIMWQVVFRTATDKQEVLNLVYDR
jgi:hypothetical protein